MTVGELRAALAKLPDELEVVVRASFDDDDVYTSYVGTPHSASFTRGCDDEPFFAIDCDDSEES